MKISGGNGQIVPFGKYKNQPVEVLAQDKPYMEWLTQQPWFRERYQNFYTQIINNFGEPSETPEHNALQVLFLEPGFCSNFLCALEPGFQKNVAARLDKKRMAYLEDVTAAIHKWWKVTDSWYAEKRANALTALEPLRQQLFASIDRVNIRYDRKFEDGGVDVKLDYVAWSDKHREFYERTIVYPTETYYDKAYGNKELPRLQTFGDYSIEIKPTVGDDYPAILRQMRANDSDVLFLSEYCGTGASEQQFIKTFELSEIDVVFHRDVIPWRKRAGDLME